MIKEIATIGKNAGEEIKVQLTEFKGHDLLDLRVWTKPGSKEGTAEGRPTKKGLTVRPDIIQELIEALTEAGRVYYAGGRSI
jgi:hypothetical protein